MRRIALLVLGFIALQVVPASGGRHGIVGGRPATQPYLWMASLQSTSGSHFCGGSLVRPRWILTAKHCVVDRPAPTIGVRLGSHSRSSGGQLHSVSRVRIDPNFASDSAVLELATPSTLEPIRIGMPEEIARWAPGTMALATGWGTSVFLVGPSPDQLHEVEVPIVSDADCTVGPFRPNGEYETCAGEKTGGKDTCQGDSGGPLMVPDARGRLIVVGTTWKGVGCGFPLFYGIYASVGEGPTNAWLRSVLPPESAFAVSDGSSIENDEVVAITVHRTGTTARNASVSIRTLDGTAVAGSDYTAIADTLTFAPDETARTILIPLLDDGAKEGDETFMVELSAPVDASVDVRTGIATILDDD